MSRLAFLLVLGLAAWTALPRASPDSASGSAPGSERVVLLELFTSQGCSSCPPADRLLSRMLEDPAWAGRIAPIAWHVDYWNYIGWQDPFSAPEWSERQRRYASALLENRVYTPQLIVDGRRHCVGSQETEVLQLLTEALRRPVSVAVDIARLDASGEVTLELSARRVETGPGPALEAWLTVVESSLETPVGRGENRGRSLRNDRVVRSLQPAFELPADRSEARGRYDLELDPSWNPRALGVVAFLQDPDSLEIHGAAALDLDL